MELLVVLGLLVAVFVGLDVLWAPPPWLRRLSDVVADRDPGPRVPDGVPLDLDVDGVPDVTPAADPDRTAAPLSWELFSPEFVHRRLLALSDELDRLDRDRSIFARGFHTLAARSAYDALRAEERRFVDDRPADLTLVLSGGPVRHREELEL
jgi:hypothetical protein